jgi:KDO2-lipid IV(A) lauroyltransferase
MALDSDKATLNRQKSHTQHSFRLSFFHRERTYKLTSDALEWHDQAGSGRIAYSDIAQIHTFKTRKFGVGGQTSALVWRCSLTSADGTKIELAQDHYVRLGVREDRGRSFRFFVNLLTARVSATNPHVGITQGRVTRSTKPGRLARLTPLGFKLLRSLPSMHASTIGGTVMRSVGPWIPEHRVGRENLAAAFPEMPDAEIERIMRGAWDNYGRTCAEIPQLDRIYDLHDNKIVLDAASIEELEKYRRDRQPALIFTAHLANWEIIGPTAKALGVDVVVPVRTQHVDWIANILGEVRLGGAGTYIPIDSNASSKLKSAIDRGAYIAVMIDQHIASGIDVVFFGRPCKVTPLPARLARALELPIKGIRAIRLADHRFQIETVGPIEPPRDHTGRIDIQRTMQLITSIVEEWVRETPDQWLWMHRRWR